MGSLVRFAVCMKPSAFLPPPQAFRGRWNPLLKKNNDPVSEPCASSYASARPPWLGLGLARALPITTAAAPPFPAQKIREGPLAPSSPPHSVLASTNATVPH